MKYGNICNYFYQNMDLKLSKNDYVKYGCIFMKLKKEYNKCIFQCTILLCELQTKHFLLSFSIRNDWCIFQFDNDGDKFKLKPVLVLHM